MQRQTGFGPLLIAITVLFFFVMVGCDRASDETATEQTSTTQTSTTQSAAQDATENETSDVTETAESAEDAEDTTEATAAEAIEETDEPVQAENGESEENPVVIRLGDYEERLSDFDEQFEIAMMGVAAQQGTELNDEVRAQLSIYKPQFLDQRATELALLNEARDRGLSVSDEDLEAQVTMIADSATEEQSLEDIYTNAGFATVEAFRAYLSDQLLVEQLVQQLREGVEVSEEDVASAYEARAEEFTQGEQVCARHILLDTEEDAQAVLEELKGGADFAELAKERSTGPSGPDGGDLSCFTQDRMVAPFGEAAFAAKLNEPVGPVQTEFGYHVILVYDRHEAGQAPLEEVAPQLEQQLSQEAFIASIDSVRESSGVEVFPEVLTPASLPPQSTEDASVDEGDADPSEESGETTQEDSE